MHLVLTPQQREASNLRLIRYAQELNTTPRVAARAYQIHLQERSDSREVVSAVRREMAYYIGIGLRQRFEGE